MIYFTFIVQLILFLACSTTQDKSNSSYVIGQINLMNIEDFDFDPTNITPKQKKFSFKACIRDLMQNPVYGETFEIIMFGKKIIATTKEEDGCLYWNNTIFFDYYALQDSFYSFDITFSPEKNFNEKLKIKAALNPFNEKNSAFSDMRFDQILNLIDCEDLFCFKKNFSKTNSSSLFFDKIKFSYLGRSFKIMNNLNLISMRKYRLSFEPFVKKENNLTNKIEFHKISHGKLILTIHVLSKQNGKDLNFNESLKYISGNTLEVEVVNGLITHDILLPIEFDNLPLVPSRLDFLIELKAYREDDNFSSHFGFSPVHLDFNDIEINLTEFKPDNMFINFLEMKLQKLNTLNSDDYHEHDFIDFLNEKFKETLFDLGKIVKLPIKNEISNFNNEQLTTEMIDYICHNTDLIDKKKFYKSKKRDPYNKCLSNLYEYYKKISFDIVMRVNEYDYKPNAFYSTLSANALIFKEDKSGFFDGKGGKQFNLKYAAAKATAGLKLFFASAETELGLQIGTDSYVIHETYEEQSTRNRFSLAETNALSVEELSFDLDIEVKKCFILLPQKNEQLKAYYYCSNVFNQNITESWYFISQLNFGKNILHDSHELSEQSWNIVFRGQKKFQYFKNILEDSTRKLTLRVKNEMIDTSAFFSEAFSDEKHYTNYSIQDFHGILYR